MKRQKIGNIIMAVVLSVVMLTLTGCQIGPKLRKGLDDLVNYPGDENMGYPEYGYFRYRYKTFYYSEGTKDEIVLCGLTEEGQQQEIIVVPSEIEGEHVEYLSCESGIPGGAEYGKLKSSVLKTIYFPSDIRIHLSDTFKECDALEKIVIINTIYIGTNLKMNDNVKLYWPNYPDSRHNYDTGVNSPYKDSCYYFANVSYMYNYEDSSNEGFYWVDNFDYGTVITYIPPEPTRVGYTFGGWYKEDTCENKWNFEVDTLPEAQLNDDGEEIYQETKLYAKWIRKKWNKN